MKVQEVLHLPCGDRNEPNYRPIKLASYEISFSHALKLYAKDRKQQGYARSGLSRALREHIQEANTHVGKSDAYQILSNWEDRIIK